MRVIRACKEMGVSTVAVAVSGAPAARTSGAVTVTAASARPRSEKVSSVMGALPSQVAVSPSLFT